MFRCPVISREGTKEHTSRPFLVRGGMLCKTPILERHFPSIDSLCAVFHHQEIRVLNLS